MKLKIIPILLILSLGFLGSFGFLIINNHNGGNFSCLIADTSANNCPTDNNSLALAIHHISGLRYLTQFIINSNSTLLIFSVLLIVFLFLIFLKILQQTYSKQRFVFQAYHAIKKPCSKLKRRLLHWLALRNHSDPYAPQRVRNIFPMIRLSTDFTT